LFTKLTAALKLSLKPNPLYKCKTTNRRNSSI